MKLIITLIILTISTLGIAQKKHWTNRKGIDAKKKFATSYYTIQKNKPNKDYIVKKYDGFTKNLTESINYLTKKIIVKEGEYFSYYRNNNMKHKGLYLNNKKEGKWTTYTDDKKLQSTTIFSKGEKNGKYEFYSTNGSQKGQYLNNKKDKEWQFYNKDGTISQKINYKNDLQDGKWTTYYTNGNIKEVMLYKKGKFIRTIKRLDINGNETKEKEEDDLLYMIVENQPEFPGGSAKMMQYLASNTKYPVMAIDNGIQGRVYVSFVVEKDGTISNVENAVPKRKVHKILVKEAIRVVKRMPKWKAGRQRGKDVRVKYTIPVNFKIR